MPFLGGNNLHPVGSTYESTVLTPGPAEMFGGVWKRVLGKFSLAASEDYPVGSTGGTANHTLTVDETPSHYHTANAILVDDSIVTNDSVSDFAVMRSVNRSASLNNSEYTSNVGGGQPHNNMPPYEAFYKWKRIA